MHPVTIKNRVRARDGHKCVKCGMTRAESLDRYGCNLDVHRVDPGSAYTIDGCITLCRECHGPEPKSPWGVSGSITINLTREEYSLVWKAAAFSGLSSKRKFAERAVLEAARKAVDAWYDRQLKEMAKAEARARRKKRPQAA